MEDPELNIEPKTERELILLVVRDLTWVKKQLSNHLRHHWMAEVALLGVIGSLMVALLIEILRH